MEKKKSSKDASQKYQTKVRESIYTLDSTVRKVLVKLLLDPISANAIRSNARFHYIMKGVPGGISEENIKQKKEEIILGASDLIEFLAREHARNVFQTGVLISICRESLDKFNAPELQTMINNLDVWKSKGYAGYSSVTTLPDALEREIADGNIHLLASVMIDYVGYLTGLKYTLPVYDIYRGYY